MSPSGPTALEAFAALMASAVAAVVKEGGLERGLLRLRGLMILREDFEDLGVP